MEPRERAACPELPSLLRTRRRRPDLFEGLDLTSRADQKLLRELEEEGEVL